MADAVSKAPMRYRDVTVTVNGIPCVPGDLEEIKVGVIDHLAPPWTPKSWPRESAACLQVQLDEVGLIEQHITDAGLARLPEVKRGDKVQVEAGRVSLEGIVIALVRRPPVEDPA